VAISFLVSRDSTPIPFSRGMVLCLLWWTATVDQA
jgi:hypothetical protein